MARAKRSFSAEFREKAVAYMVEQNKPIAVAARESRSGSTDGMDREERDETRRLRAENRELKMRVELLKKSGSLLRERNAELIFCFIDAEKANFPISFMCAELGVSRQGYYAWQKRQGPAHGPRRRDRQTRRGDHPDLPRAPGPLRHSSDLGRVAPSRVGMNRVARIMAEAGLVGRCGRRAAPRTTISDPAAAPAPNRLERNFSPDASAGDDTPQPPRR